MKAISLKQPWASLVAEKRKTIETRRWATKYRGDVIIVSSRFPKIKPAGYALAVARIADCRPMKKSDERRACCKIYKNAKAWLLEDIRRIKPFPVKGTLGLYDMNIPKGKIIFDQ